MVVSRLRRRLGTAIETRSRARACDAAPRAVTRRTSKAAAIGRGGGGYSYDYICFKVCNEGLGEPQRRKTRRIWCEGNVVRVCKLTPLLELF